MRGSFSLGRVLGFPVDVHFTLLLLLAAVFLLGGGTAGLVLTVLTFVSVLAHELGHSVVARLLGVPISGITLYPFGGMARMTRPARSPADEIFIAAAGPAVSLLLAVVLGMAWLATGAPMLMHLAGINGMLGLFNLLPALPMDGGRIFRAALVRRKGQLQATRIAARVARWSAVGLAVWGLFSNPMLLVIAVLIWSMAGAEERAAEEEAWRRQAARIRRPDLSAILQELHRREGRGPDGSPVHRQVVVEVDPVRS